MVEQIGTKQDEICTEINVSEDVAIFRCGIFNKSLSLCISLVGPTFFNASGPESAFLPTLLIIAAEKHIVTVLYKDVENILVAGGFIHPCKPLGTYALLAVDKLIADIGGGQREFLGIGSKSLEIVDLSLCQRSSWIFEEHAAA